MSKPGGVATFNIADGYNEAILRGYRLGFLTDLDYRALLQCDTMADVVLNLGESDYAEMAAEISTPSPSVLREKALEKLVAEFDFLRASADAPLSTFLDYIKMDFQLDNLILVLRASKATNVDLSGLLSQCHPLGAFDDAVLKSLLSFEQTKSGFAELYQSVLIDTPIGKYFAQFLKMESEKGAQGVSDVQGVLQEIPMSRLEAILRKLYLEDFYFYCQYLGGETAEVMAVLLKAKCDALALSITLNSFGTPLNDVNMRAERRALLPSIGFLYPEGTNALSDVGEELELATVLRTFPAYKRLFDVHQNGDKTLDDAMFEREVRLCEWAFEGQFHYGAYYAFVYLKLQELRNLSWLSECISQRQKDRSGDHFVPLFSSTANRTGM